LKKVLEEKKIEQEVENLSKMHGTVNKWLIFLYLFLLQLYI
jgi:hypothetical protein